MNGIIVKLPQMQKSHISKTDIQYILLRLVTELPSFTENLFKIMRRSTDHCGLPWYTWLNALALLCIIKITACIQKQVIKVYNINQIRTETLLKNKQGFPFVFLFNIVLCDTVSWRSDLYYISDQRKEVHHVHSQF